MRRRARPASRALDLHARTRRTILFVPTISTMAVLIADRIVVMRGRQGAGGHGGFPLARPRGDLGLVAALAGHFAEIRYRVWQALHAPAPVLQLSERRTAHDTTPLTARP